MLGDKEIQLIHDYIMGKLPPKEAQNVEQSIQENPLYKKEALFQRLIQEASINRLKNKAIEPSADAKSDDEQVINEARAIVEKLGADLFIEEEEEDIEIDIDIVPDYSLEELIQLFKPLPQYERKLETARKRSSASQTNKKQIVLDSPKNRADIITGILVLKLASPLETTLNISIFNNQDDKLIDKNLPPAQKTVNIDIASLPIGRYYIRLKAKEYTTLFRSFFIKKIFMPSSKE